MLEWFGQVCRWRHLHAHEHLWSAHWHPCPGMDEVTRKQDKPHRKSILKSDKRKSKGKRVRIRAEPSKFVEERIDLPKPRFKPHPKLLDIVVISVSILGILKGKCEGVLSLHIDLTSVRVSAGFRRRHAGRKSNSPCSR